MQSDMIISAAFFFVYRMLEWVLIIFSLHPSKLRLCEPFLRPSPIRASAFAARRRSLKLLAAFRRSSADGAEKEAATNNEKKSGKWRDWKIWRNFFQKHVFYLKHSLNFVFVFFQSRVPWNSLAGLVAGHLQGPSTSTSPGVASSSTAPPIGSTATPGIVTSTDPHVTSLAHPAAAAFSHPYSHYPNPVPHSGAAYPHLVPPPPPPPLPHQTTTEAWMGMHHSLHHAASHHAADSTAAADYKMASSAGDSNSTSLYYPNQVWLFFASPHLEKLWILMTDWEGKEHFAGAGKSWMSLLIREREKKKETGE